MESGKTEFFHALDVGTEIPCMPHAVAKDNSGGFNIIIAEEWALRVSDDLQNVSKLSIEISK